ncbi:glycosyltransferase family 2 protein [Sneathiella chinensis]|uniref:Dolichol-phosphate mannosyltransferase n=1 Tax=Sneathiella chinensis TaxID=349750 RepID=A0ABQ5U3P6_9PROT|nr:glycosyltransferase family 2 protein [Sneathiella chinensis]GLQ05952.1 dolichol-phosphate mannosyltransferase [Sneathiella chinensis]
MGVDVGNENRVSVVVPVLNEAENVGTLVREIGAAMDGWDFEMIFVDDGSTDRTVEVLRDLAKEFPTLRCLHHLKRCGQSAAIRTGVKHASGGVIVTLDGDGQNPPSEIPRLARHLIEADAGVGLVQGQRAKRQDTLWKKVGSRLANKIRQGLLQDGVKDSGCGLKAFYRSAYLELAYFDHLHRFMPVMMIREGYRVAVLDVSHRERQAGTSKYGNLQRALVGIYDLLGVVWLRKRRALSAVEEVAFGAEPQPAAMASSLTGGAATKP